MTPEIMPLPKPCEVVGQEFVGASGDKPLRAPDRLRVDIPYVLRVQREPLWRVLKAADERNAKSRAVSYVRPSAAAFGNDCSNRSLDDTMF